MSRRPGPAGHRRRGVARCSHARGAEGPRLQPRRLRRARRRGGPGPAADHLPTPVVARGCRTGSRLSVIAAASGRSGRLRTRHADRRPRVPASPAGRRHLRLPVALDEHHRLDDALLERIDAAGGPRRTLIAQRARIRRAWTGRARPAHRDRDIAEAAAEGIDGSGRPRPRRDGAALVLDLEPPRPAAAQPLAATGAPVVAVTTATTSFLLVPATLDATASPATLASVSGLV